jgi:hypothetical protein
MGVFISYSIVVGITAILYHHVSIPLAVAVLVLSLICMNITNLFIWLLGDKVLQDKPIHWEGCNSEHDKRRHATYPSPLANSWYHFVDSDELVGDKVSIFF